MSSLSFISLSGILKISPPVDTFKLTLPSICISLFLSTLLLLDNELILRSLSYTYQAFSFKSSYNFNDITLSFINL